MISYSVNECVSTGHTDNPSPPACASYGLLGVRAEREAAYNSRKSDMGKWVAPVQANRQAETLDFTQTVSRRLCPHHVVRSCLVGCF